MRSDSFIHILGNAVLDFYWKRATRTEKFAMILVLCGVFNFLIFLVFCVNIGGSAGNGEIHEGRYYVSEHGRSSEVSPLVFRLNRAQGISLWMTHTMAILGMVVIMSSSRKVR